MPITLPTSKLPLFDPAVDDGNAARQSLTIEIGGLSVDGEPLIPALRIAFEPLQPDASFSVSVTAISETGEQIISSATANVALAYGAGAVIPLNGIRRMVEVNSDKFKEVINAVIGGWIRAITAYTDQDDDDPDMGDFPPEYRVAFDQFRRNVEAAGGEVGKPMPFDTSKFKQ